MVQAHARVDEVRAVPPDVFWPRPQVDSAILRIEPEPSRLAAIRDYALFARVVRGAFGHRRKSLSNALATSHVVADKQAANAALAACAIEPSCRAEHVGLDDYIALANFLTEGSR